MSDIIKEVIADENTTYLVRALRESDYPIIYSIWASKIRKTPAFVWMDPAEFAAHKKNVIEGLVEQKRAQTLVACGAIEEDYILGWCCAIRHHDNRRTCYFAYTKDAHRQRHIFKTLLETIIGPVGAGRIYYPYWTTSARHYDVRWNTHHDPYTVYL